jgi:hypothetical protein
MYTSSRGGARVATVTATAQPQRVRAAARIARQPTNSAASQPIGEIV